MRWLSKNGVKTLSAPFFLDFSSPTQTEKSCQAKLVTVCIRAEPELKAHCRKPSGALRHSRYRGLKKTHLQQAVTPAASTLCEQSTFSTKNQ
jgi:hypothetical protein